MAERPAGGGSPRSPAEQPCAVAAKEVPDSVASTASGVSTTAPPEDRRPPTPPVAPAPPAAPGQDESSDGFELRFDATLQQIHAGIGQAYGHAVASSLQSPKWDRRAQALKAVASALEGRPCGSDSLGSPAGGAGSAGGAVGWRFSCQLLHHVMRDKVMPVRLAACDLFMATFAKTEAAVSQAEGRFALGTLLEHLIDRLGDSNLRLHESARRCVLFAAEMSSFFGLGSVLARLRARLESSQGSERARVHFGILDAIGVLLEHFPGRRGGTEPHRPECAEDDDLSESGVGRGSADSWTQDDVAPFIAAGMDDALGQRVRDRAVALAVAVYQTFGAEAMLPLLTGLRPAKQALLRKKFEESELEQGEPPDEDGGEECLALDGAALEGLVVCGSGVRPPAWSASPAHATLPGALGDEEALMDGILEDAGLVFGGAGLASEPPPAGAAGGARRAGGARLLAAGNTWEGNDSCACLGDMGLKGRHMYANKSVPWSFGGDCAMWDKILDECQVSEPPDHCWRGWCFVDPCSCNLSIPPRPSKLLQGVLFHGRPIHYSYATCGESSPEEADEAVQGRSSVADVCQPMPHEADSADLIVVPA